MTARWRKTRQPLVRWVQRSSKVFDGMGMIPQGSLEAPECILTRSTGNHTDSPTEEPAEPFADGGLCIALISATLYVDPNLSHQRFPPISPILHNSPRV